MYTICVDDTEKPNEAQRPTQLEHSENYEFIHSVAYAWNSHLYGVNTSTSDAHTDQCDVWCVRA